MRTKPMPMEVREGSDDNDADDMKHKGKKKPCAACRAKGKKDCSCNAKGKQDGDCGMKKDSLSPREYLDACDLGIQRHSRTYIRARLATEKALAQGSGR